MCDAVALANQLEQLLDGKQPDAAGEQFLTDASVFEVPTLFSSETFKGRAKIVAKWKKDQKDGLKFLKKHPFTEVRPGVVSRKASVSVLIMTLNIQHTLTFTPTGKLDKMVVKKL